MASHDVKSRSFMIDYLCKIANGNEVESRRAMHREFWQARQCGYPRLVGTSECLDSWCAQVLCKSLESYVLFARRWQNATACDTTRPYPRTPECVCVGTRSAEQSGLSRIVPQPSHGSSPFFESPVRASAYAGVVATCLPEA